MPDNRNASPFVNEFKEKLLTYMASNEFVSTKIQEAVEQNDGQLSRLFDRMDNFTPETMKVAYNQVTQIDNEDLQTLQTHLREITIETASQVLNEDWTDLNGSVKKALGDARYNQLMVACKGDHTILVDRVLQATAVLYTQVVTDQLSQEIINSPLQGEAPDPMVFNESKSVPMNRYMDFITKKNLHPFFQHQDTLFKFNGISKIIRETIKKLTDFSETLTKGTDNHDKIQRCIDDLKALSTTVDSKIVVYGRENNIDKADADADVLKMQQAIEKTISTNLTSASQVQAMRTFGERVLNVLLKILSLGFLDYKSESYKKAQGIQGAIKELPSKVRGESVRLFRLPDTEPEQSPDPDKSQTSDDVNTHSPGR